MPRGLAVSLRFRLIARVADLLLFGLVDHAVLAFFNASWSVRTQVHAMLLAGRQTVDKPVGQLQSSHDPERDLHALIVALRGTRIARPLGSCRYRSATGPNPLRFVKEGPTQRPINRLSPIAEADRTCSARSEVCYWTFQVWSDSSDRQHGRVLAGDMLRSRLPDQRVSGMRKA